MSSVHWPSPQTGGEAKSCVPSGSFKPENASFYPGTRVSGYLARSHLLYNAVPRTCLHTLGPRSMEEFSPSEFLATRVPGYPGTWVLAELAHGRLPGYRGVTCKSHWALASGTGVQKAAHGFSDVCAQWVLSEIKNAWSYPGRTRLISGRSRRQYPSSVIGAHL
eukprot:1045161-Rhodomonas_salina.1